MHAFHGVFLQLVDFQAYTSLVASAAATTAIVAPLLKSSTASSSRPLMPITYHTIQHCKPHAELRILACIRHQDNVPAMLSLLGAISTSKDSPICVYAMHVVELVGRSTPLLIVHKPHKKSVVSSSSSNFIFSAFRAFERRFDGHVLVQLFVSPNVSMHKDVCLVALERKVALVLIPLHKQRSVGGGLDTIDPVLHAMNPKIIREAPCSVGIVVHRHSRGKFASIAVMGDNPNHVGVFFLGGPDDGEALCYASHMAEHPRVTLTVWRFVFKESVGDSRERRADEDLVANFRMKNSGNKQVVYREVLLGDGVELLTVMRNIEDMYDMVMVGRHQTMNADLVEGLELWSENPELGPLGDLCSSSDFFGGTASVLVMQQQQQLVRRAHS